MSVVRAHADTRRAPPSQRRATWSRRRSGKVSNGQGLTRRVLAGAVENRSVVSGSGYSTRPASGVGRWSARYPIEPLRARWRRTVRLTTTVRTKTTPRLTPGRVDARLWRVRAYASLRRIAARPPTPTASSTAVEGSGTIAKPHASPKLPTSMLSDAGVAPAAGVKTSQVGMAVKCR